MDISCQHKAQWNSSGFWPLFWLLEIKECSTYDRAQDCSFQFLWCDLSNPAAIWCLQQIIPDKTAPNRNLWARISPKIGTIFIPIHRNTWVYSVGTFFFSSFLKHFPSKPKNGRLNGFIIYNHSLVSKDHMFLNWHWFKKDKKQGSIIKVKIAWLFKIILVLVTKPNWHPFTLWT